MKRIEKQILSLFIKCCSVLCAGFPSAVLVLDDGASSAISVRLPGRPACRTFRQPPSSGW